MKNPRETHLLANSKQDTMAAEEAVDAATAITEPQEEVAAENTAVTAAAIAEPQEGEGSSAPSKEECDWIMVEKPQEEGLTKQPEAEGRFDICIHNPHTSAL
jgi:hypothetical protein